MTSRTLRMNSSSLYILYFLFKNSIYQLFHRPDLPNWTKHEFQDTLVMSTYLNAYLVSNFNNIGNEGNQIYRVPFKVFSRGGTQEFANFALSFGQDNMNALEEYIDFPYEFPKLDKVAVPDFAAGAMENWGLVVYRYVRGINKNKYVIA